MGGRGTWSSAWYGRSRPKSNASRRIVAETVSPPVPTGFIVPQLDQSMFSSTVQTPTPSNNADLALNLSIANTAADAPSPDSSSPAASPFAYTVMDQEAALGGAIYPFLAQTRRAWRIIES